jgi:hypothetical protein
MATLKEFQTHTGEVVKGKRLCEALKTVAKDHARLGYAIYKENAYADHVTEATKIANLKRDLITAHRIRQGRASGFWLWQRVNTVLTGECIALLPMY